MRGKVWWSPIAAIVFLQADAAMAQVPASAVGTWRGTLERYRNDPGGPDRVLVIGQDGKCKWDYAAKAANPSLAKTCSVTANGVTLFTSGNSTVDLKFEGGRLRGTFATSGNNTYHLSMIKQ